MSKYHDLKRISAARTETAPAVAPPEFTAARHEWEIEWGKLVLLGVALLFGFVLVLVALVGLEPDDPRFAATLAFGTTVIGTVLGYITGNGRLATKGQQSVPAIARRLD